MPEFGNPLLPPEITDLKPKETWQSILNQSIIPKAIAPTHWGTPCWKFIDCLVFSYPVVPTSDEQNALYTYIHALKNVLPCYTCRVDFSKMLEDDPIERHLHSRETLARWVHEKHNMVNQKTGKAIYPFEVYVESFSAQSKSHDIKQSVHQPKISQNGICVAASAQKNSNDGNHNNNYKSEGDGVGGKTNRMWIILGLLLVLGAAGGMLYMSKTRKR